MVIATLYCPSHPYLWLSFAFLPDHIPIVGYAGRYLTNQGR